MKALAEFLLALLLVSLTLLIAVYCKAGKRDTERLWQHIEDWLEGN